MATCASDDYCMTGTDFGPGTACCARSAVANGEACNPAFAPSCDAACLQFAGCFAGCP